MQERGEILCMHVVCMHILSCITRSWGQRFQWLLLPPTWPLPSAFAGLCGHLRGAVLSSAHCDSSRTQGKGMELHKGGSEVLGKGSSPERGGQHPSPTLLFRWTYCQSFFHPDNGAASAASSRFGLPCPPWPANILHKPMTALLRHKQFRALLFYLGPLIVLWYLDLGAVVLRSSLANSGLASPVSVAYTQLCQRWVWGGSDIALR